MLFDQVTPQEAEAARIFTGATMACFIAASFLRRHAWTLRLVIAAFYLAGIASFIVYYTVFSR